MSWMHGAKKYNAHSDTREKGSCCLGALHHLQWASAWEGSSPSAASPARAARQPCCCPQPTQAHVHPLQGHRALLGGWAFIPCPMPAGGGKGPAGWVLHRGCTSLEADWKEVYQGRAKVFLASSPARSIHNCSFFSREAIWFLGEKRDILRQLITWISLLRLQISPRRVLPIAASRFQVQTSAVFPNVLLRWSQLHLRAPFPPRLPALPISAPPARISWDEQF